MHVLVSLVVSLIMSTVHCFNKILETYPIFIIAQCEDRNIYIHRLERFRREMIQVPFILSHNL